MRTWKNREGRSIQARMIARTADTVTLFVSNGRTYVLQVSALSDEDQAYFTQKDAPDVVGPEDGWFVDADEAMKAADAAKRPILMLFTGSDWCGYCIRLEENVLSKKDWSSFAKENLVLLKLDFPRKKTISEEQLSANKALAGKYGIRGYPTLVLTDAAGKKMESFGYGGQKPSEFIDLVTAKIPK